MSDSQVETQITFGCFYGGKFDSVDGRELYTGGEFVDEEIDEYLTPVCSDDEEDDNVAGGYFRYKKGSGELKLRQSFDSLEDFKQAMVDYVLKEGWNVKYVRWEKDKSELKCASEAEEGEENCMWKIYCSYEEPLQKWLVKVYNKKHTCMKTWRSKILSQEVIAKLFVDDLRDDPTIMPKAIQYEIQKRWSLIATVDQCRKTKKRALDMIQEENDLQFSRLRDYRLELIEIKGKNESPSKKKAKQRDPSPTKISREKRIVHCRRCGESGHNTRRCQNVVIALHRPPKKKKVLEAQSDIGEGSSQPMQSQDNVWLREAFEAFDGSIHGLMVSVKVVGVMKHNLHIYGT
ncbi:unnamed protein product [Thlaspi arvense]|uniref:CCHC-type domain-containing protein n=1 Tax=Thlaspi arvense TaxID=13288 RepID=A0AAU9S388_THLAR|nr:unnamed protein product [Thlaspi arvense]